MNYRYEGACTCGNVEFLLDLPRELDTFAPRACDCDYCSNRQASYLSHPKGVVKLQAKEPLKTETQGSEQASFQYCNTCKTLIVVTYSFDSGLKGALNSSLLKDRAELKKAESISPKLLRPTEKLERWNELWLDVSIQCNR